MAQGKQEYLGFAHKSTLTPSGYIMFLTQSLCET